MKHKLLTVLAAALALAAQGSASADDDDGVRRHAIVGLWMTEVTLRVCATGDVAPVPNPIFPALNTFHKGGTSTEHGSRASPATRGTGQGIWERTGARTFESRIIFQTFDSNGFLTGTQDVRRTVTLSEDGNSYSATALTTINRSGLPPINGCATEVGQRVEL